MIAQWDARSNEVTLYMSLLLRPDLDLFFLNFDIKALSFVFDNYCAETN
jgi:hypothetical protein